MNKLIIIFSALCAVSPVVAMELAMITEQENKNFSRHLLMAVGFSKKVVAEDKISAQNPIHKMLCKMSDDLTLNNGDIVKMITLDDSLAKRIAECKKVDSKPLIQLCLQQISNEVGDVKEAKAYVTRTRILLANIRLKKQQPTYSQAWIGEVQTQDRIDFMMRNENYPSDENAVTDYIATFIYQLLWAPKID